MVPDKVWRTMAWLAVNHRLYQKRPTAIVQSEKGLSDIWTYASRPDAIFELFYKKAPSICILKNRENYSFSNETVWKKNNHYGLNGGVLNLSPGRPARTIEILAAGNDQVAWMREKEMEFPSQWQKEGWDKDDLIYIWFFFLDNKLVDCTVETAQLRDQIEARRQYGCSY